MGEHSIAGVVAQMRTSWGKREFVIKDDRGHTLYFGPRLGGG